MSEGLLHAARALRPAILEARAEIDASRRIPAALADALAVRQLFRLAISTEEGGLEAPPAKILEVIEELASADASPAWIVWNSILPALLSRYLGAETRRELFSGPGLIIASSTRPSGRAVPVDGGFQISGRWSLVSGCELADLFLLTCFVEGPAGAAPEGSVSFRAFTLVTRQAVEPG